MALLLLLFNLLVVAFQRQVTGQTFTNFTIMRAGITGTVTREQATFATFFNNATPIVDINGFSGPLS